MLTFGDDYIDRLNRNYEGGKWIKSVILTESISPPVVKYFADHEEAIVFEGNTYEPLHMLWESIKTSQSSPTEGATIALSNIDGQVARYLNEIDITGMPVVLQKLHLDLLNSLTVPWRRHCKVLASRYDILAATFDVGRRLGRNRLPRNVITKDFYHGINSDVPRIF